MNCLEQLQDHKGELIRLKTQLYWYGGVRGWDGCEGRICLLLDAAATKLFTATSPTSWSTLAATKLFTATVATLPATWADVEDAKLAAAHLLIDGASHWVWVTDADVEFL